MKVALKKEIEAQVLWLKGRLVGFNKDIELLNAVFEDLPGDLALFKRKGPRTKAPFTSHHPLPPKRSFNNKLIDAGFETLFVGQSQPIIPALQNT
jgi:hypothetical protein